MLASQGPERKKELRIEEDSPDEDSSLRDYWLRKKGSKKKWKKKEKADKRSQRRDSEGAEDGTDQEGEGAPKGTLLDPTKLTPLTSRNEGSLENLYQDRNLDRTSSDLEEATPSSPQINSSQAIKHRRGHFTITT